MAVRPSRTLPIFMPRLVLVGDLKDTRPLLDLLPDGDYSVTLALDDESLLDDLGPQAIIVAALNGQLPAYLGQDVLGLAPWVAWNRFDAPELTKLAYEHGALAVLPGSLSREGLKSALRTTFARTMLLSSPQLRRLQHGPTTHPRGTPIALNEHDVLIVEKGVVGTSVLHDDGTEVLVGLCGAGGLMVGHPHDSCCLQLRAHTDVTVVVQSWQHAAATKQFAERLRLRLRHQEAWAAVAARPHLHDRVLGLLSLLAEQFGAPHANGTLIDLRLTHSQLAAATGATRATITRVLGRLRKDRLVFREGEGVHERFVVRVMEQHVHG